MLKGMVDHSKVIESLVALAIVAAVAAITAGQSVVIVTQESAAIARNVDGKLVIEENVPVYRLDKQQPPPAGTLTEKVAAAAKAIGEPSVAQALAVPYELVAKTADKFASPSDMSDGLRQLTGPTLSLSQTKKRAEWDALIRMVDQELDALAVDLKVRSNSDMGNYLQEVANGLKGTSSSLVVVGADDEDIVLAATAEANEFLKFLLDFLLKFLMEWLSNR